MAAERVESDQVQNSSPPHPLQLPQIYCGTLIWCEPACWLGLLLAAAWAPGVEKPRGASQNLLVFPLPLLRIEKGPVQVAGFGVGAAVLFLQVHLHFTWLEL